MSATIRPIVRTLIACEQVRPDTDSPNQLTLVRVVNTIRPGPDQGYPLVRKDFAIFAVVTNGRGAGEVWTELRHADTDTDTVSYRSRRLTVRFPADPLRLCGMTFDLHNILFPTAGLYWVQLWFDGDLLADLPIVAR